MQKSKKVVAIYNELKQFVGDVASQADMLTCAASLVELFAIDEDGLHYDLNEGRVTYESTPVDSAMRGNCWRTLSREWPEIGWESTYGCGGRHVNQLYP
ncbi:hypothetical protein [Azonexus sp. IMCC34839]|uniref:hypothetical protein n=1 Tax=Azonexus sp. IMCC34839 TaxID=3133695 RepID=UPI00399B36F0